jgi:molecular chaperone GrpE
MHEAIQQVETAEVPAGHVVFEVVRGFMLNERLVRPALVVVARAPAPAEASTVTEPAGAEQASTSGTEGAPVPPQSENSSGGSQ